MKVTLFKVGFPLLCLLALSSCTQSYNFKVDAISSAQVQTEGSFYLVSGNPELKESDLRFKEAATYTQTALEGKGYRKAKDLATADIVVELSFGVGEPREIMEYRSYPETYWHPGFSYAIQLPIYDKGGLIIGYQTRMVREPARSYTHWSEYMDSSTVFEKYLKLEAFDNRLGSASQEPQQLWSVVITNADFSDNIREYLPFMIAVALPYMGQDTSSQIYTSIRVDDPTVAFIRFPDAPNTTHP